MLETEARPLTILGIDPALGSTGLAILAKYEFNNQIIDLAKIRTAKLVATPTESSRIEFIFNHLCAYIDNYRPDIAVIENQYVGGNKKTAMGLSRVRGVIQLACQIKNVPIQLFEPSTIKQVVTNDGNAGKELIQEKIVELYKEQPIVHEVLSEIITSGKDKTDDIADALSIAHTYIVKGNAATTV